MFFSDRLSQSVLLTTKKLLTQCFFKRSRQTGREVNGLFPETYQVSVERLWLLFDKFLFGKSGLWVVLVVTSEVLYWAADEPPMWGFAVVFQSELIFCVAYIFVSLSAANSAIVPASKTLGEAKCHQLEQVWRIYRAWLP